MTTFNTQAKILFLESHALQYKDSWAWRKFYHTKLLSYTVIVAKVIVVVSSNHYVLNSLCMTLNWPLVLLYYTSVM